MKILIDDIRSKVRREHLERTAYVYVRQSSLHQVENNRESTEMQYGLAESVEKAGWAKERIVVVDEDQGKSSAAPNARSGFAQLVAAVASGAVGIVVGREASRLARNSPDWANLMFLCRFTDTLIVDESGVYDPADSGDRMVLGIRGQLAEIELDTSIRRMSEARWNKARRGEFITLPPAGYDLDDLGQLVMSSDETIANAFRTVFEKFDELGTARQVYVWWREQQLPYPVRRKELASRPVVWVKPRYDMISRTLRHPIYAGAYAFGRSQTVREVEAHDPPRLLVRKIARKEWPILIQDHHPAYISFEKFLRNQARLRDNQVKQKYEGSHQGAPREGRALLQGLARCGHCGRRMFVAYGGRRPMKLGTLQYLCRAENAQSAAKNCQTTGGKRIDQAVVQAFLDATMQAGQAALMLVEQQVSREGADIERAWQLQIEKAEYEAQRAERQFNAVEPENRVVARELERRWNARLLELEALRDQAQTKRKECRPLTLEEIARAHHLGANLSSLWNAPTTTDRDRKRLLRILIEEVQLRVEEKRYLIRIVWKGGAITDREVPRLRHGAELATPEETVDLVRKLAVEFDDAQIARILNKQGRRGASGNPFTKEAVRCIRRNHEIPRCTATSARDPREGPFTADQAAGELKVSMSTLHRWLRDGVLAGRQATTGAPWQILLTEDVRRRLTGGDAPREWVGLTVAAQRLGLAKSHVAYLVKTGKLNAVRATVGKRQCWKIDLSSAACGLQPELFDHLTNNKIEEA
jgi:DNA invertase Pin-like site-specific DNA recombinase